MRTFILRARKGITRPDHIQGKAGEKEHIEVIAHSVMNAFFVSNDFRTDVEFYLVLESSVDFPRTIRLAGGEGLSFSGFHEQAIFDVLERALRQGAVIEKNETKKLFPGVDISGFGFEKLVAGLLPTRPIYCLGPKGEDIREVDLVENPVFMLTDHIPMPKNTMKSLKRQGVKTISVGRKMLFASQVVVVLHHEMDRLGF